MLELARSGNDEFFTPKYAVTPIIKYLKNNNFKVIWCPFDTKESNFVKVLTENGFTVINTHIHNGEDFFKITPPECDCIVSNPPYSIKGEVIGKLFNIGKPFAMLVGINGLFESEKRFAMFESNEFEVMYLSKRIAYFSSYSDPKPQQNPPFSSIYLTSKVLPSKICFERINKKELK